MTKEWAIKTSSTTTNESESKYCEWIHLCVCKVQRPVRTCSVLACQCGSRAWEPGPVWVPGTSWSCHSSGEEEHPHQSPEEVITMSTTECLLYTWNNVLLRLTIEDIRTFRVGKTCTKISPKTALDLTVLAVQGWSRA